MKREHIRYSAAGILWLVAACGASAAFGEKVYLEHERHGAWEMSLQYSRIGSEQIVGVIDTTLDADAGSGWGVAIGYNFSNQLLVGMEFVGVSQDYRAVSTTGGQSQSIDHDLDLTTTHINGTWHFRPDGLTPYVTLGAGWTNVDSNIRGSDPYQDCWWDAWWGYTCTTRYPTHDDTKTSLNAAVGVRWDFHKQFFARISYGRLWLDPGDSHSATPSVARLEVGLRR